MRPVSTDAEHAQGEHEHFFGAAKVVAGLTMCSRVLGLLRDMVLVPLGGPLAADAFWIAFSVPHLFRRLFGEGALSAAFIPVFTESAEARGWDRARLVLANTAGLLALVLTVMIALIELGLLAWLLGAPGAWDRQLTIQLTMVLLPFTLFICLLALCSAALNSRGHFVYPAAAPALLNVGLIAVGWSITWMDRWTDVQQFYILSVTLVACSVGQLAGAIWLIRRMKLSARWTLRPVLPEIRSIAARMAPTVVPLGLMQVCDLLARLIAKGLTATPEHPDLPLLPGVVRCHYAAGRLYQLPMGVMGISLATVVFPLLSRCAARADRAGLRAVLNRALRLCFFLGIPSAAGLILLADPIFGVIFEHREFTAADTARAAGMLRMYSLGMPAYFCVHILLRAFFARKDTRTPMITSSVLAVVNVGLVTAGIFTPLRSAALGLATAVASSINALVLGWVLHRQVGRLGWRSLLRSTLRTLGATAIMAAAVAGAQWGLGAAGARRLVILVASVAVGAAAFLAAARLLRCGELRELIRRREKSADDSGTMV